MARIEATANERLENLRSEIREMTRKINGMEWYSSKYEATLEDIRNDVSQAKQCCQNGKCPFYRL